MQTTLPIWVPISVAVIGILAAWGSQIISNIFTNRREDKRQAHERELKQRELEVKKQEQRREERIQAYRNLARITATINPNEPYTLSDLAEALSEIELTGGSQRTVETARNLYDRTREVREKAREVKKKGKDPAKDDCFKEVYWPMLDTRQAFVRAAREELGQSPDVLSPISIRLFPTPERQRANGLGEKPTVEWLKSFWRRLVGGRR